MACRPGGKIQKKQAPIGRRSYLTCRMTRCICPWVAGIGDAFVPPGIDEEIRDRKRSNCGLSDALAKALYQQSLLSIPKYMTGHAYSTVTLTLEGKNVS
jgi:hypothetical protein